MRDCQPLRHVKTKISLLRCRLWQHPPAILCFSFPQHGRPCRGPYKAQPTSRYTGEALRLRGECGHKTTSKIKKRSVDHIKYCEIKKNILRLMDKHTMAGDPVAESYNDQADVLDRIPAYLNTAITNIRTYTKPLSVLFPLTDGSDHGDMVWYTLPQDLWRLRSGGVFRCENGRPVRSNEFRLIGDRVIAVPKTARGEYMVEYFRYPLQVPENVQDSYEVPEDPEVLQAAMLYTAAMLLMQEDSFAYANLFNEYESLLVRMGRGLAAQMELTADVYAFGGCGM